MAVKQFDIILEQLQGIRADSNKELTGIKSKLADIDTTLGRMDERMKDLKDKSDKHEKEIYGEADKPGLKGRLEVSEATAGQAKQIAIVTGSANGLGTLAMLGKMLGLI